jgi:hypothetical protein
MPAIALISRIPWAWSLLGGFGIGWLGGWPGEGNDEGAGITGTLFNISLVVLGVVLGVFALRKLAD